MALDIGDALKRGYQRTVARSGLVLVAIAYALNLINGLFGPPRTTFPDSMPVEPNPLITVPYVVDSLLSLVFAVGGIFVAVAAFRIFTGEETETVPTEAFTEDAFVTFLNVFIGGIVFAFVVGIGFLLFIVPGLFLLATLIFWPVIVAVEGENFVEAFQQSWNLTSGHRLTIFGLGVAVLLIGFAVTLAFTLPAIILGPLDVVLIGLGTAFTAIFGDAVLASAYNQLLRERAKEAVEAEEETDGPETAAGESRKTESGDEA